MVSAIASIFLGKKLLITLFCVFIFLWFIIFLWFLIEEKKYKENVVHMSSFNRPYSEKVIEEKLIKEYDSNAAADALYFTTTTFGTFGYGDISPKTTASKIFISAMHFIVIIFGMGLYENIFIENKTIKDLSTITSELNESLNVEKEKNRKRSKSETPISTNNFNNTNSQRTQSNPDLGPSRLNILKYKNASKKENSKSSLLNKSESEDEEIEIDLFNRN